MTDMPEDGPLRAIHVYQDPNGLWVVTSESEDGTLRKRATNVPTQDDAIKHEAEKLSAAYGGGVEIIVEEPFRPPADAEHITPHSKQPPRRAGE